MYCNFELNGYFIFELMLYKFHTVLKEYYFYNPNLYEWYIP